MFVVDGDCEFDFVTPFYEQFGYFHFYRTNLGRRHPQQFGRPDPGERRIQPPQQSRRPVLQGAPFPVGSLRSWH